jgi:pimeloyl-ACP methyl ester carboxylesterase
VEPDRVAVPAHGGGVAQLQSQVRAIATAPNDDPFPTLAVNCIDYPKNIASFADFAAMTRRARRLAPHTQGANEAWIGITGCMRWPVPLANPPHRARVRGAPPILLVSSTHDPSTPYVGARRILRQIPGAVLLTREGDGHTSSWLVRAAARTPPS